MNPELNAKIELWRNQALEGSLSIEDMKEAILALREGRISAAFASETFRAPKEPKPPKVPKVKKVKKDKAASPAIDLDALFRGLEG